MKTIYTLAITVIFFQLSAKGLPTTTPDDFGQLRSNLYIVASDGSTVLMDGALTQYYSEYSNDMDKMDARKMSNFSENWGLLRNNKVYVIERRHTIEGSDSIFFKMWNMRVITYQIELIASNLDKNGRQAVLEDKYLQTATPLNLNGTTFVNFSVTGDTNSKASDRFRIIFSNREEEGVLPFDFKSVRASANSNLVNINWLTGNEKNVKQLDIERSVNRLEFSKLYSLKAYNNTINNYRWIDVSPKEGDNYYRIASKGDDGRTTYSEVVKVSVTKGPQKIQVFPNPAKADNFNIQMINQEAGLYNLKIINSSGLILMQKNIQHSGGSRIEKIQSLPAIPGGIYRLEIVTPSGERKNISVVF